MGMKTEHITDLISMGYRKARPNTWVKPVGYHFVTFEEDKMLWTNWFLDANDKNIIWDSEVYFELKYGNFLDFLKHTEAHSRFNVATSAASRFEYLSENEMVSMMM